MLTVRKALCKVCVPMDKSRKRVNINIEIRAWHDFQKLAKSMNLSASRFVEILVRSQLTGRSGTVDQVMRGLYSDLIEARHDLSKKEKEQVGELFKDDK